MYSWWTSGQMDYAELFTRSSRQVSHRSVAFLCRAGPKTPRFVVLSTHCEVVGAALLLVWREISELSVLFGQEDVREHLFLLLQVFAAKKCVNETQGQPVGGAFSVCESKQHTGAHNNNVVALWGISVKISLRVGHSLSSVTFCSPWQRSPAC